MSKGTKFPLSPSPETPESIKSSLPPAQPQPAKRKRPDGDNDYNDPLKPIKRKKAKRAKYEHDEGLDPGLGLNLAIGKLDSRLLADYVAQRTKRFAPNLSLVELDDLHVSGDNSIKIPGYKC